MTFTGLYHTHITIGQILAYDGRTIMLWSVWNDEISDIICSLCFWDGGLKFNPSNGTRSRSKVDSFSDEEFLLFSAYYYSTFL